MHTILDNWIYYSIDSKEGQKKSKKKVVTQFKVIAYNTV